MSQATEAEASTRRATLWSVALGGERDQQLRLCITALFAVLIDTGMMVALLRGLELRRAGGSAALAAIFFVFGVACLYGLTARLNRMVNSRVAAWARVKMISICRSLVAVPLVALERFGRGELMARLQGDANQVASSGRPVVALVTGALRVVLGGAVAAAITPDATTVVAVVLLAIAAVTMAQLSALRAGFAEVADEEARIYDLLGVHVEAAVALKAHAGRAAAVSSELLATSQRTSSARTNMFSRFFGLQFAGDALVYALMGINVFFLPALLSLDGESVRELNLVVLWLVRGVVQLTVSIPRASSAATALTRLGRLEDEIEGQANEAGVHDEIVEELREFNELSVHALAFRYPSRDGSPDFTLGPLELCLRRGELVFVTGANGSGKSTFARILAGLYRPDMGGICLDGRPIDDVALGSYRHLVASVFVEHQTFRRVAGFDEAAHARAATALATLGLADHTAIVDGEITNRALSTGQTKRLALAIARASDRPILVLDEWAAEQDPQYRAVFYDELLPALRDEKRLIVVVTHDDQYFDRADRGLVFEGGRLVEASA